MIKASGIIGLVFFTAGMSCFAGDRVDQLIQKMTLEEKIQLLGGGGFSIQKNDRLGIPEIFMLDGPAGVRRFPSTAYPAPVCMAATWNKELNERVGDAIAETARAKGISIWLGPGMNIYRAPQNGRNFEYLGEDPFLAGQIAASQINGVQRNGVLAVAKHFVANYQEDDRHHTSSDISERALHEIYLPAFRTCVKEAHVACVMSSYNPVNGVETSNHRYLVDEVLRGRWGFDGFLMSDWGATDSDVFSVEYGVDLEMPTAQYMTVDNLIPALERGDITENMLNRKVARILETCNRFGLLDKAGPRPSDDEEAHDKLVKEVAREGFVLLKNRGRVLPLNRDRLKTVLVIGPNAKPAVTGGGGSSHVTVRPKYEVSLFDAIKKSAGDAVNVVYRDTSVHVEFQKSVFSGGALHAEFYGNRNLEGTPVYKRDDKQIDFKEINALAAGSGLKDEFSVRWTGGIEIPERGYYQLEAKGDDGFRVFLDGNEIMESWRNQAYGYRCVFVSLDAGRHDIRLEYFQGGGGGHFNFGYAPMMNAIQLEALVNDVSADTAIVCAGFNDRIESEFKDRPYALLKDQQDLIRIVSKKFRDTIVLLNAGSNASMAEWEPFADAVLHCWYPGQSGATVAAEIMFGDTNPSGKLPITIEKKFSDLSASDSYFDDDYDKHVFFKDGIFAGYRHFDQEKIEPLYPFGYGLSYTTFQYKNPRLSAPSLKKDGTLTLRVDVTNTGARPGKETVQLYIADEQSSLPRPPKELKGFEKIELQPGETQTVSFTITPNALSFYSPDLHDWVTELGTFRALVGRSSRDIQCESKFSFK